MLAVWGYVEADFQRDYGINLTLELPHMSWRRFKVLLNGLSPFGALATHYDDELKRQNEERQKIAGAVPGEVQSFWDSIMGFRAPE